MSDCILYSYTVPYEAELFVTFFQDRLWSKVFPFFAVSEDIGCKFLSLPSAPISSDLSACLCPLQIMNFI